MMQNSGPTGSSSRAFSHGRSCSQPHPSIPISDPIVSSSCVRTAARVGSPAVSEAWTKPLTLRFQARSSENVGVLLHTARAAVLRDARAGKVMAWCRYEHVLAPGAVLLYQIIWRQIF